MGGGQPGDEAALGRRQLAGRDVDRQRLVVAAPQRDGRVVTQEVDRLAGLAHGLLADAPRVAPLQGQVLPQEQPGLVGRVIQLRPCDVGVDAEEVEPGLLGQRHIARDLRGRGFGQRHARRALVRPLEEQTLTVDAHHPVIHADLTQAGAERLAVAHDSVRFGHVNGDVHHVGLPQRVRPPQRRSFDDDGPLHAVLARGQRMVGLVLGVAHRRAQPNGRGLDRVEAAAEAHHRARLARVGAQAAQPVDAHGAGLVDVHRAPDAARVPFRVEAVPVLEDPGDVALGGAVGRSAARALDRQDVLVACGQSVGDLEGVGHEVALGVAHVGAVEPHVALVEEPVEHEPLAPARRGWRGLEPVPVQERPVVSRERGRRAPVSGDVDRDPRAVVELGGRERAAQALVGARGAPLAREIHDRRT